MCNEIKNGEPRKFPVLIQLSFANPVKETSGEVLIPTLIVANNVRLKLVGMALAVFPESLAEKFCDFLRRSSLDVASMYHFQESAFFHQRERG